jgi:PAS domain S-box-containing protein
MSRPSTTLTGVERVLPVDDVIVSKTDTKGIITYVNRTFMQISGYSEEESLGKPHNILRHPRMPRGVFKLLWDTIQGGQEIFAYVLNRAKDGDHYWVLAHVTPTFDDAGTIIGYHSNRRAVDPAKLTKITPLYDRLLTLEQQHTNPKDQVRASVEALRNLLQSRGVTYEQFFFSI